MATDRRRRQTQYRSDGNVAYAPEFERNTVRKLPKRERTAPPKHRTKECSLTRTRVRVREAGQVAPFAVAGFLLVGVLAALLLLCHTQYTVVTDQVVSLRRELNTLETEYAALTAEYELVFDMERIQSTVGGSMVRPSSSQIEYIDLSEPDSVELYTGSDSTTGIIGVLNGIKEMISDIIEYFR